MKLEIKDESIYLDGTLLKGVIDYKLEESLSYGAQLTVTLLVDSATVMPPKIGAECVPEVKEHVLKISPKAFGQNVINALNSLNREAELYRGDAVDASKPDLTDRIREIVREEIAAHEERLVDLVKESLHVDATDFLAGTDGILRGTSE